MSPSRGARLSLEKGSTLLEASAGTGKTHSITDLYVRLLVLKELTVDQILVVTFTEAATAELRDRIRRRVHGAHRVFLLLRSGASDALETDDSLLPWLVDRVDRDRAIERLAAALRDFDQAEISTIHGFCHRALQRHAFESGVEFDLELVTDLSPIVREVTEDFWVKRLHDAPAVLIGALHACRVSVDALVSLGSTVVDGPDLVLEPGSTDGLASFEPGIEAWNSVWSRARAAWEAHGAAACETILSAFRARDLKGVGSRTRITEEMVRAWIEEADLFFSQDREPGAQLPGKFDPFFTCTVTATTLRKKPEYAALDRDPVFGAFRELERAAHRINDAIPDVVLAFYIDFVDHVRAECTRRKRDQRIQTFGDLLHDLSDALTSQATGDRLRASLQARYRAALIDEFQDTDPVQWFIFRRIFSSEKRWLQIIGDPKQAIYSFRGADIHTYLSAKNVTDRDERLDTNYRSDAPLVAAVNRLFDAQRLPHAFVLSGIDYAPVKAHHAEPRLHFKEPRASLELRFCRRDGAQIARSRGGTRPPAGMAAGWARSQLAALVASDIAKLLQECPTIDCDGMRRGLAPQDIAVLVLTNRQAHDVRQALRQARIPSVIHGADSVLATQEAVDLAHLMAAMLDPGRLSAVKTALSTRLMGLRASELVDLEEQQDQWDRWSDRLRRWRQRWIDDGFMRMFREVLQEHEIQQRVLGLADGERRMTNLLHLAELVHSAAAQASYRPQSTLTWLRTQINESGKSDQTLEESAELRLESDADAVEVVTVFKAKGLQYPVVFCPFLWRKRDLGPGSKRYLRYHDDEGRKLDVTPKTDKARYPEAKRSKIEGAEYERLAEDMRLIYVATTRARHRCVVYWGWFNEASTSALHYLLHGKPVSEDASVQKQASARHQIDAAAEVFETREDEDLLADLEAIRDGSGETIGVTETILAEIEPRTYRPARAETAEGPRARQYTRDNRLDSLWRRGSFSGLTRHEAPSPDAGKEDDELLEESDGAPTDELPRQPIDVPVILTREILGGGRQTGIFLHELYEHLDFTAPESIGELVGQRSRSYGLDEEKLVGPLSRAVASSLEVPLGDGVERFHLGDIPARDRVCELQFDFPVAGGLLAMGALSRKGLCRAFERHRSDAVPASYLKDLSRLAMVPLRGFMTGSIDLVFRRGDRWYLADYKSNHLGDRLDAYSGQNLTAAMTRGHYILQYHIYLLALHRWLGWRLPGYEYDGHFGGVFYLFLRGMMGDHGPRRGVFFDRPRAAMVHALDTLMREGDGGLL